MRFPRLTAVLVLAGSFLTSTGTTSHGATLSTAGGIIQYRGRSPVRHVSKKVWKKIEAVEAGTQRLRTILGTHRGWASALPRHGGKTTRGDFYKDVPQLLAAGKLLRKLQDDLQQIAAERPDLAKSWAAELLEVLSPSDWRKESFLTFLLTDSAPEYPPGFLQLRRAEWRAFTETKPRLIELIDYTLPALSQDSSE